MEHDAAPVGRTYVLGQFPTGEALVDACYKVREKGFETIDTHSPYPLHGGDEALELRRIRVPRIALAGALSRLRRCYLLSVYINALIWPLSIVCRPPTAPP